MIICGRGIGTEKTKGMNKNIEIYGNHEIFEVICHQSDATPGLKIGKWKKN
jgi:hypothetical protein